MFTKTQVPNTNPNDNLTKTYPTRGKATSVSASHFVEVALETALKQQFCAENSEIKKFQKLFVQIDYFLKSDILHV